jgi:drug/metabolite transporter (DMT)-like permease
MLFLFQIVVGFYSRKVFLDCLGAEVLGVNTTLGNILSFLNLTELGIGIAMVTSLYKPIQAQDYKTINEILTVQGYLYRRIALLLCLLSVPILIAMPWLFPSTECGLLYVYMAYVVFLGGSLSGYLWNYRQVLIGADQKNFKLMPWIHAVRYAKIFLQLFFLLFTPFGVWA